MFSQNLGTAAAFTPALYSDTIINSLIAQGGLNNTNLEIRLKRAAAFDGSQYQESRLRDFTSPNFTSLFNQGGGIPVTWETFASALGGALSPTTANTFDTNPPVGNNSERLFTWAWSGHNNQKGFSYGSSVVGETGVPGNDHSLRLPK